MKTTDHVDSSKIRQVVDALLAFVKQKKVKEGQKKLALFDDESLFELQVSVWKVGGDKTRTVPIHLPHNMYQKDRDALLIVKDIKDKPTEHTEFVYKDLLSVNEIKGVSEVMPFSVLKKEYKPFEAKRNLAKSYDIFLADEAVRTLLPSVLGKEFYKRNKFPIKVNLEKDNLKATIDRALRAAYVCLSNRGSCSSVNIAHTGMSAEEIAANVKETVDTIGNHVNGGWPNIKSIHLRTKSSLSIPVYTNLISPEWDLKKSEVSAAMDNTDIAKLQLQLKLEQSHYIEAERKRKDLDPSEKLKPKRPKTALLYKAEPFKGTRKERRAKLNDSTPRQRLRQRKAEAKIRQEK